MKMDIAGGHFTDTDILQSPMGYVDTPNLYQFADCDPEVYVDPLGTDATISVDTNGMKDADEVRNTHGGSTSTLPAKGKITVKVKCKLQDGKWHVTTVDDSYVIQVRLASKDQIRDYLKEKNSPSSDADVEAKVEDIKNYETNQNAGKIKDHWDNYGDTAKAALKKLSDPERTKLEQMVKDTIDVDWLNPQAGYLTKKLTGDKNLNNVPGKASVQDTLHKLHERIEIKVEDDK